MVAIDLTYARRLPVSGSPAGSAVARPGSAVARPVVADHADGLVERRAPHFRAARGAAGYPHVAAASSLCSGALARVPGNGHCARPPRMMQAALERDARPYRRLLSLGHVYIQTCERLVEKISPLRDGDGILGRRRAASSGAHLVQRAGPHIDVLVGVVR